MKTYILFALIITMLFLSEWIGFSQTGIIPDINQFGQDVVNSPWGASAGYGRSLKGNNSLTYEIITDDLVTNLQGTGFSSGPIAGVEQLWTKGANQQDSLSGGWQASMTGHPFSFIGKTFLTNVVSSEMLYQLVATPRNSTAPVGAITGTALTLDFYPSGFYGFHFKAVGLYENRSGQGNYNGNWLCGGIAVTHLF